MQITSKKDTWRSFNIILLIITYLSLFIANLFLLIVYSLKRLLFVVFQYILNWIIYFSVNFVNSWKTAGVYQFFFNNLFLLASICFKIYWCLILLLLFLGLFITILILILLLFFTNLVASFRCIIPLILGFFLFSNICLIFACNASISHLLSYFFVIWRTRAMVLIAFSLYICTNIRVRGSTHILLISG